MLLSVPNSTAPLLWPTFVQLTAFLVRHLPDIAPTLLVFHVDNETAPLGNRMAAGLSGYQQRMIHLDYQKKRNSLKIVENALFINFLPPTESSYIEFQSE